MIASALCGMVEPILSLFVALALGGALPSPPVELWGGLTWGMSRSDVETKYPGRDIELSADCIARIKARYNKDNLTSVTLSILPKGSDGFGQRERCNTIVLAGIQTKYGAPVDTNELVIGKGVYAFRRMQTIWVANGVKITHSLDPLSKFSYVTYDFQPTDSVPDVSSKL